MQRGQVEEEVGAKRGTYRFSGAVDPSLSSFGSSEPVEEVALVLFVSSLTAFWRGEGEEGGEGLTVLLGDCLVYLYCVGSW